MSYYFSKVVSYGFDEAIEKVTEELTKAGFGILTQIDVQKTLKEKKNIDWRPYRILGACNPSFAHLALESEDKIGLMMPCNVVVQETPAGAVEVSAVDPRASMQAVDNPELGAIAGDVSSKLREVVEKV